MPTSPVNIGKDFNFFKLVTITSTDFQEPSDVSINIKFQQSFSLINYGNATVEYSFNGNTVHGDMRPGTPSAAIVFDNRVISSAGIWFRVPSGGSAEVRVEAWARV